MKFVVQWSSRMGGDAEDNVEAAESLLKAFGSWAPPASVTISEFVARVDGRGGYLVVETDDLLAIDLMVAQYVTWFDYDVYPVVDVADGALQFAEGVAWAKQFVD